MKQRELLKIFLFLTIPLPVLYFASLLIDKGLQRSRSEEFDVWNDLRSGKLHSDVLIMGASRAWVHISPAILDSVLHTDAYNIGLDNWCFLMQYTRLQTYLEHNPKPAMIIQSLDYNMFDRNKELYGDIQFVPYLSDKTISKATEGYIGSFNSLQRYLPMYKYRNNGELMMDGIASFCGINLHPSRKHKGYEGMDKTWDSTFADFVNEHREGFTVKFDSSCLRAFDQYLQYCKDNRIKVILVYTPEYFRAQQITRNRSQEFAVYQYFAKKYGLTLLDYSADSLCYNTLYFYNSQHLNKKGSEIFSEKLAHDLMPLMTKERRYVKTD